MFSSRGDKVALFVGVILLAATSVAAQVRDADGYVRATRLGGTTSFYKPPLQSVDDLRRMADRPAIAADIRAILAESDLSHLADKIIDTMRGSTSWLMAGECAQATPDEGVVVECDLSPGLTDASTMEWMVYRPNIQKRDPRPVRLHKVRWMGKQPFKAFLFRVFDDDKIYTFMVPKPCGNLALMKVDTVERLPIVPSVEHLCNPATGELQVTISVSGADVTRIPEVRVLRDGVTAGMLMPPSWTLVTDQPGTYTFDAVDLRGRAYPVAPLPPVVPECPKPPPPPVVAPPVVIPPPPVLPVVASVAPALFFDALIGNERRVREFCPVCEIIPYPQNSLLLGLKFGTSKRFRNDWELAGALGVGLSFASGVTDTGQTKVRRHVLFLDGEVNKYFRGNWFLGTGLSLWDISRPTDITTAWLFHAGVPLTRRDARYPLFLLGEGRVFLDKPDNMKDNYLLWGGIRMQFPGDRSQGLQ